MSGVDLTRLGVSLPWKEQRWPDGPRKTTPRHFMLKNNTKKESQPIRLWDGLLLSHGLAPAPLNEPLLRQTRSCHMDTVA